MTKKRVLVFGATGRQGGSVARHLIKDGNFDVRAFVRDDTVERAKELEAIGVKLYKGDMSDTDSMKIAMKNCDYIYAVTDYWDNPRKPFIEIENGKKLMNCAHEMNIKHVVFSCLEDTKEMTKGKYSVECCDGKSKVLAYAREIGLKLSQIRLSFYMENFMKRMKPKRSPDGFVVFEFPMNKSKLDLICAEDVGKFVVHILKQPEKHEGKCFKIASDSLTGEEISNLYSKVTGDKSRYKPLTLEEFKRSKVENADILADMFLFYQEFEGKLRDVEFSRKCIPNLLTFEQWLQETKFRV